MEAQILKNLDEGEIEDSHIYALTHGYNMQELDGILKSLDVDQFIVLNNKEKKLIELTQDGIDAKTNGTPEYLLASSLTIGEKVPKNEIEKKFGKLFKPAFNECMKKKWLKADKKTIERVAEEMKDIDQFKLKKYEEGGMKYDELDAESKKEVDLFKRRKLLGLNSIIYYSISKGLNFKLERIKDSTDLTFEMLQSGSWKDLKFKPYNLEAKGKEPLFGSLHPLHQVRSEFCTILLELGFEEMQTNNFVESSFWNFDALFQPQQHPARDQHDTFFIEYPQECSNPPQDYLSLVKSMHEHGGHGSKGYNYPWQLSEAKKNILRTHTTANSAQMLYKLGKQYQEELSQYQTQHPEMDKEAIKESVKFKGRKFYSIDRVFRNETVDKTHLPEFNQVEGLIVDYDLSLRDLMGVIQEFFRRLGIPSVKFKPTYNPYTEPSMEIYAFHPQYDDYVEIGNSGIFRPEMLIPMGLPEGVRVCAWGLSLERPTMIHYQIKKIKKLLGTHVSLEFIKNNPVYVAKD